MIQRILPALAILILIAGVGHPASAQEATGTVTGSVVDAEGNAVVGANVELLPARRTGEQAGAGAELAPPPREGPRPVARARTDDEGQFTMEDVPAGSYFAVARAEGKGTGRTRVTVTADEQHEITITLREREQRPRR